MNVSNLFASGVSVTQLFDGCSKEVKGPKEKRYTSLKLWRQSSVFSVKWVVHVACIICILGGLAATISIIWKESDAQPEKHVYLKPNKPYDKVRFPIRYDLFVHSSYYYPVSKSMGNNTLVMVVNGNFHLFDGNLNIFARLTNDTTTEIKQVEHNFIAPHRQCLWTPLYFHISAMSNMKTVELNIGNEYRKVPFVIPSQSRHDVVGCISPVFANDRWQQLVMAAHVAKKYGMFLNFYIRSAIEEVFSLAMEYEKEGYLRIQPWPRINITTYEQNEFNPNLNVEFRSQAAMQTDCLLQYKDRVEFITFLDLDDIIIPRLGSTYVDEFNRIFDTQTNVGYLVYRKINVDSKAETDPALFTLRQMISTMDFTREQETGKVVTRPNAFNSTWIHSPNKVKDRLPKYDVPLETNVISHLRRVTLASLSSHVNISAPLFKPVDGPLSGSSYLISLEDMKELQADLDRLLGKPTFSKVWSRLNTEWMYSHLIDRCFNETFYAFHYFNRETEIGCPGPERCNLPRLDIACAHARALYHSSRMGTPIDLTVTYALHFEIEQGCIV